MPVLPRWTWVLLQGADSAPAPMMSIIIISLREFQVRGK